MECSKLLEREKRDDLFPVFDFIGAAAGHDDFPQWTVGELLQYVRHQFFCPRNRGSSFDFVSEMQRKEKNPVFVACLPMCIWWASWASVWLPAAVGVPLPSVPQL